MLKKLLPALCVSALLCAVFVSPAAAQGQICTTFAGGNAFAGNMWDAKVLTDVTVTSFDVHLGGTVGEACDCDFYTTPGTYVGVETDPTAWAQVGGTTTVTSNGFGVPTNVDVSDFSITAGDYGMYFDQASYTVNSHVVSYTNGNGVNQFYSNSEFELTLGLGRGNPAFSGSIFSPRVWNGCINYDTTAACLSVTITGDCAAGPVTIDVTGGTPNGIAVVLFSHTLGSDPFSVVSCTVATGLSSPVNKGTIQLDGSGNFQRIGNVSRHICAGGGGMAGHGYFQLVDLRACCASNVFNF